MLRIGKRGYTDRRNLRLMQSFDLDKKEFYTYMKIGPWIDSSYNGVYVAFSGGKDSSVLLQHIVRRRYPWVPAVFVDTGLELPSVRELVRQTENVIWLQRMIFRYVVTILGPFLIDGEGHFIMQGRRYAAMPVWKFRDGSLSYPGTGLLECVMRSRGLGMNDVLHKGEFEDPFAIAGMDQAARRIARAIEEKEKVLVFGDYDTDGVCSAFIVTHSLRSFGVDAEPGFPSRREGYGIRVENVKEAAAKKCDLIVTVDNGTSAFDAVNAANSLGIDIVITDHHEPEASLPEATIVNPKLPGSISYRDYSGAGVAYKTCHAVASLLGRPEPQEYLDLVCLATVVDVCPITGENFHLSRKGLLSMRRSPRPGLAALLSVAGSSAYNGYSLGWVLGPRINATGRYNEIELAYQLLGAGDTAEAESLARKIEAINDERINAVQSATDDCLAKYDGSAFAIYASPDWEPGIVGGVAGRIVDAISRPTAVGAICGDKIRFSARSVGRFNLFDALSSVQSRTGLLLAYGGHEMAAGFTIDIEKMMDCKAALNRVAVERLIPEDLARWVEVDAKLESVPTPDEVSRLDLLEPFGKDNPQPTFYVADRIAEVRRGDTWSLARMQSGLKLFVYQAVNEGDVIHSALTLAVDEYYGRRGVIGRAADVRSFVCTREDLLEQYSAWRKGQEVQEWAEKVFGELGLDKQGKSKKTSLFHSPTFLQHGVQVTR